jgi:quercetin dioxygenase-like cupin family protein
VEDPDQRAGQTDSEALTAGVALLAPNGRLCAHHHPQPEVYVILESAGVVTIDGVAADVAAGTTVFIPGSVVHAIEAGESELRFAYVLAADAFADVTYVFEPNARGEAAVGGPDQRDLWRPA